MAQRTLAEVYFDELQAANLKIFELQHIIEDLQVELAKSQNPGNDLEVTASTVERDMASVGCMEHAREMAALRAHVDDRLSTMETKVAAWTSQITRLEARDAEHEQLVEAEVANGDAADNAAEARAGTPIKSEPQHVRSLTTDGLPPAGGTSSSPLSTNESNLGSSTTSDSPPAVRTSNTPRQARAIVPAKRKAAETSEDEWEEHRESPGLRSRAVKKEPRPSEMVRPDHISRKAWDTMSFDRKRIRWHAHLINNTCEGKAATSKCNRCNSMGLPCFFAKDHSAGIKMCGNCKETCAKCEGGVRADHEDD